MLPRELGLSAYCTALQLERQTLDIPGDREKLKAFRIQRLSKSSSEPQVASQDSSGEVECPLRVGSCLPK